LTRPSGDLSARLAQPVFCAVPIGTPADPNVTTVPSAGPYYVASYTPGRQIVLKRNPYYRGPRPRRPDTIVYTIGVSPEAALAAVETGRADYVAEGVPAGDRAWVAARYGSGSPSARQGHQRYFEEPAAAIALLALNTGRPLFSSARLRRAVSEAIDRTALASEETRYGGHAAQPFDHYLPPDLPGSVPAMLTRPVRGNLFQARLLAGGAHRSAVLYTCDQPPCPQEAQILVADLARIGIQLDVQEMPKPVLYRRLLAPRGDWDIATAAWAVGYFDPADVLNSLFAGGRIRPADSFEISRFDNPRWNQLLAEAARLRAPARYRAYAQLDAGLVRQQAPAIVYAYLASSDFFSARVGCQVYQPVYGIDLAALCLRR
jgi:peptide/nickel transport system substrate-binding protein